MSDDFVPCCGGDSKACMTNGPCGLKGSVSERCMSERPWTPGRWRADLPPYDRFVVDGNSHPVAATESENHGWESGRPQADAALIALAPEMAEAILAVADAMTPAGPLSNTVGQLTGLLAVADKLRRIGGEHE